MDYHPKTEREDFPERHWENNLARHYHQRIKGKIIFSSLGLFSLLILCLYHLVFNLDDFSGNPPANHEYLTKK